MKKAIIPRYAWIPIAGMLGMNMLTYFGTRILTTDMVHHSMETAFDRATPFIPAFTLIYVLAFAQWIICYVRIAQEGKRYCTTVFTGEMIAKALCLVIFLVYPTTLTRPEIAGDGMFEKLTALVYRADAPDNLFPSIHCLESWVCFRGSMHLKGIRKWYLPVVLTFSLLVFASTLLIKQHVAADVAGGVLAAETGLFVSRRLMMRTRDEG